MIDNFSFPENTNFEDCNWSALDRDLLEFSWRLYAGPHTTKFILEDQFNHLQHIAKAQNKGRAYLAKPSQYFYAASSPILRTANLPSPEVTYPTFQACMASRKDGQMSSFFGVDDLYRPSKHPIPASIGTETEFLKKARDWKAAGFASNRVATAATAYLLEDQRNEWSNAQKAWACFPVTVIRFSAENKKPTCISYTVKSKQKM